MNAERLHVIALALRSELTESKIVESLQQIRDSLERWVQNPQQAQFQQQVSQTLTELQKRLAEGRSNSFSPAWRQIISELGVANVLGNRLAERLRDIFERHQITHAAALQEVKQIHDEAVRMNTAVDQLCAAFKTLRIPSEDLAPGECELGVLVPRVAIDNKLAPFAIELREINFILTTFAELTTGRSDGFDIRSVSSTDLTVYLNLAPRLAAAIADAVAWIIDRYKALLEIRKSHAELRRQGVPQERLQGIEEYANSFMETGMDQLVGRIVESYCVTADEKRRNELSNGLRISLNKIANRIDRGYNIEIRVEPIKHVKGQVSEQANTTVLADIAKIQETSKILEFMNLEGSPILTLPEPQPDRDNSSRSKPATRKTVVRKKKQEEN